MATEEEANESTINVGEVTVNNSAIEHEQNGKKLGDNQYFFEDEVFYIDKLGRVKFGLIIETCDSYSSEDDDDDDEETLSQGNVRVAWYPHGREHVRSENTIGLADRTLMPGDVVRRMTPGSKLQAGYVRDIKITADVKVLGVPFVIKNVAAERLRPLNIWQRDCTVCLDSWVGSAKDVDERAVLRGFNGVRFEISSADYFHFKEASTSRRPSVFSPLIFYPGNIVIGKLLSLDKAKVLTSDIPIPVNRKGMMVKSKFFVESVRTEGVIVQWQCKALSKNASKKIVNELELPKVYVAADQLDRVKRLNVFESCVLQIADRSYLTFQSKDKLISKYKWEKEIATKFREMFQEQQRVEGGKKKVLKSSKVIAKSLAEYVIVENENCCDTLNTSTDDWTDVTNSITTDISDAETELVQECSELDEHDDRISTIVEENESKNVCASSSSSVKKPIVTKNLLKKSITVRHKPLFYGKQQSSSMKWMQRSPFVMQPSVNKIGNITEGKEMITETLLVYSTVSVVWQDGTVENDIPSTHLYPIHHLDNHEFFPGDFTILSRDDPNITFRDYGVIQTVDHQGRTAKVKWFQTYTLKEDEDQTGQDLSPVYKGETEVSVYDLKDHPDFTYRPGGMVIRVSNFIGEDATSTAGQVLDNCIDGRVKVAWINGHISRCWPQDLFDVGHHEQNDYAGDSDSWETQSENSGLGGVEDDEELEKETESCSENNVVFFIERTRSAIAGVEDILRENPQLQDLNVSNKLFAIYKICFKMDQLMQTTFFHQDTFLSVIDEAVATNSTNKIQTISNNDAKDEEANQMKNNLQQDESSSKNILLDAPVIEKQSDEMELSSETKTIEKETPDESHLSNISAINDTNNKKVFVNVGVRISSSSIITSSLGKTSNNANTTTMSARHGRNFTYATHVLHVRNDSSYSQMSGSDAPKSLYSFLPASEVDGRNRDGMSMLTPPPSNSRGTAEINHLLSYATFSIQRALRMTKSMKLNAEALLTQDDSGNFSTNNSDISNTAVGDRPLGEESPKDTSTITESESASKNTQISNDCNFIDNYELSDQFPSHLVCLPFCVLLKVQLQKVKNDIELQSGRLSTYKAFSMPQNDKDSDKENDDDDDDISENENPSECPCQIDGTAEGAVITNKGSENIDIDLTENTDSQTDVSVNMDTENWIVSEESFKILSSAPKNHKFYTSTCEPSQPQLYFRAVQREHRLLKSSLPKGIWIRFYEDRIDLLSVMMEGPKKTPYENGLYFFDLQLNQDYPKRPPACYYISYCVDRLNPNLYEEGKVCVSLLGTWSGRDVEVWGPNSTLLQVLVSIQGLILVPEPYFNEAGYEKQKGSQQGLENSRMYNEMVIIKVTQATIKMLANPPMIFLEEITEYYKQNGSTMYERLKVWLDISKAHLPASSTGAQKLAVPAHVKPEFPLLPGSRGFCLTLEGLLSSFVETIDRIVVASKAENTETIENSLPAESAELKAENIENNDESNES